ncbi:MAG: nucleotidyl transferase AbiEii/AbiGii toxin family protein [Eubacteriales bacterium]|nr:nucleotidyl transferase AbiEii/AbiGii toxin family protein [Eubacteriales bacterium]
MDKIIEQMLEHYPIETLLDQKNSIKEIIQEIVLCGLSRANFFNQAAFYGGTALRIFYGLDRFSEDLDFSLKVSAPSFSLTKYLPTLEKELRAYGLHFKVETKEKSVESSIQSAFLKGSTKEHLLMFYANELSKGSVGQNELIKVKFEVDTNPPEHATFETKYRLLPIPYEVTLYDMSSLFAGKIHAVICRGWKNRVKGRDLYDFVFYLTKGTAVNLNYLVARLSQTNTISAEETLTIEDVKQLLYTRFQNIDYDQAKQDVSQFIKNPGALDLWGTSFFSTITESLKAI